NSLGVVLVAQGRFADAEPVIAATLDAAKHVLESGHSVIVNLQANLAETRLQQGRFAEAETLLREVLEQVPAATTDVDLTRVRFVAASKLATLCTNDQRLDDAESLSREALAGFRRVDGPHHPYTLAAIDQLALVKLAQKQPAVAADLLSEAYEASCAASGPH